MLYILRTEKVIIILIKLVFKFFVLLKLEVETKIAAEKKNVHIHQTVSKIQQDSNYTVVFHF